MNKTYTLSKTWQVLGPFPIGTREQDFGADPLENYGKLLKPKSQQKTHNFCYRWI